MADWQPGLYTVFEEERTQPARDLLAAVRIERPVRVVDLGCGPGNSTELLVQRYGAKVVEGLDSSAAMIEAARERLPDVRFVLGDIARWQPEGSVDLIYANASLQWVGAHESLFPSLFSCLRAGGVLAVQMPDNSGEPSHRLMGEVAAAGGWANKIAAARMDRVQTLSLEQYYDLLSTRGARLRIWRTIYVHSLPSVHAIATWLQSTGLRPFLAPLTSGERAEFLALYVRELQYAYPRRPNGEVLLAFPRKFLVAERS